MPISQFPTILDVFTAPQGNTPLSGANNSSNSHGLQHQTIMDALTAIQKVIGITNSADATTIQYKLKNHTHVVDWNSITNKPSFNYAETAGSATSATNATNAANLKTTNWQISELNGVLQFKYDGVVKATLDSSGNLTATGDIIGFSS